MNYANKVAAVQQAYHTVQASLEPLPMIEFGMMGKRQLAIIKVWNEISGVFDNEALLNIFWEAESESPAYVLSTYPHSNVPFAVKKGPLDYDQDGVIEVEDVITIATQLFTDLNT